MILREALIGARERLRASGSDEAEIEAKVLLGYALNLNRATFLQLLNEPISNSELQAFERVLYRRFAGEPTAYIIGSREFYGLDFKVTPAVLIPRPETEMLVEAVVASVGESYATRTTPPVIVDIGTGSGAIAVSLAKALPVAAIYATDLSPQALQVARENARRHAVLNRVSFRRGDLLEPLEAPVDVIAANLPYVNEADWQQLPREIREHEPRLALASGTDGLKAIRTLLRQAPRFLKPGGSMFLEFGIGQNEMIRDLAQKNFPAAKVTTDADFGRIPRLLSIRTVRRAI